MEDSSKSKLLDSNSKIDPSYTKSDMSRKEQIDIHWSQYTQMFKNIGWNDIPNSFEEAVSNSPHYKAIIGRIYESTDNEPTRIRNRQQFINQLIATTVYQNNKQFILKHCPKNANPTYLFDESTPLNVADKSCGELIYNQDDDGPMHDDTDFIQMCDTPSEAPENKCCKCCKCIIL